MKLTRRPLGGAIDIGGTAFILYLSSSSLFTLGFFSLLFGRILLSGNTSLMMRIIPTVLGVLLFLTQKLIGNRRYNKWRRSFADEEISTDNSNHWFPQSSRYIPFSWWKKLRQGPWNALKRRRDTSVAEIPFEPIQSNIDEPPGPSAQGS